MRTLTLDRDDAARDLAEIPLFAALSPEALDRLAGMVESVHVAAGEVVMAQGGPPDGLYIVHAGRLRATMDGADGEPRVRSIGRGQVAGEMALISDEPRSAAVVAERDSQLLRLGTAAFDRLIAEEPEALRAVARQVVARLRSGPDGDTTSAPATIAVVASGSTVAVDDTARSLVDALAQRSATATVLTADHARRVVDGARGDAATSRLTRWASDLERSSTLVVYRADPEPTAWSELCLRQADAVVVVADGGRAPDLGPLDALVRRRHAATGTRVELVLAHPANRAQPEGTAAWLRGRPIARHHHVASGRAEDVARVARLVLHQGVTLVLSGGGARGMAEIGVLKAIEELDVPIDAVGGTSAGAVIGGCVARGWEFPRVRDTLRASVVDGRTPVDPTFPAMSLTAGRRVTERLRREIGSIDIEDLWRDFYCVSTNLSQRRTEIHRQGPVWKAIRASFAIPGVFPPVPHGDDVLIDGGVLDNLPVGEMRQRHADATVVAVDVRTLHDLRAGSLPDSGIVSGWDLLWARTRAGRKGTDSLSIARLLTALTVLGGARAGDDDGGDVVVRPDVRGFQILDFKRFDELVDRGYRAGIESLGPWIDERRPT